jgi:hypothetical protein
LKKGVVINIFSTIFFSVVIISNTILKNEFFSILNSAQTNHFNIQNKIPLMESSLNKLIIETKINKDDYIVLYTNNYAVPFIPPWIDENKNQAGLPYF